MGILLLTPPPDPVPATDPGGNILLRAGDGAATYTMTFRTDVQVSQNGLEHRHALSVLPRETVATAFDITGRSDDEETFRLIRRLRTWNPADVYLLPIPWDGIPVRLDVTGTDVAVDGTYMDWGTTNRVLVEGPGGLSYEAVIQSTAGAGTTLVLTLDVSPPQRFPAISTHVMPMRPFYLDDQSAVGRYQVNAGRWTAMFRQAVANSSAPTAFTSPTTFASMVVLDKRPVVQDLGAEDRPVADIDLQTYGAAVLPEWSRQARGAAIFREHEYSINNTLDYQYFRYLVYAMKGRQKAFLLPTWRDDLPVISVVTATITVDDGGDYAAYWFASQAHRRVMVVFADSSVGYRTVNSASIVGANSVLVLNAAVDAQPIAMVSFLETVRLSEDAMQFRFTSAVRAQITVGFVVVQQ